MEKLRQQRHEIRVHQLAKAGEPEFWRALVVRLSRYLTKSTNQTSWKVLKTALLHKKGDKKELQKNARFGCPLTFTNRSRKEASKQAWKQNRFRRKRSITDHIFTLNQQAERTREYELPLCLISVDYEKAFDLLELNAVLRAFVE